MDPYDVLRIRRNASDEEIHEAYWRLLRVYHPDVYRGDPAIASEKTLELNQAYAMLRDQKSREHYNTTIRPMKHWSAGPGYERVAPAQAGSDSGGAYEQRREESHAWDGLGMRMPKGETFAYHGMDYDRRECFIRAIELFPDNSSAWMNLGDCLRSGEMIVVNGKLYMANDCNLKAAGSDRERASTWRR